MSRSPTDRSNNARQRTAIVGAAAVLALLGLGGALIATDVGLHPEQSTFLGSFPTGETVLLVERSRWITGHETEVRVEGPGSILAIRPVSPGASAVLAGNYLQLHDPGGVRFFDASMRLLGHVVTPPGRELFQIDELPGLLVVRFREHDFFAWHLLRVVSLPSFETAYETRRPTDDWHAAFPGRLLVVGAHRIERVTPDGLVPEGPPYDGRPCVRAEGAVFVADHALGAVEYGGSGQTLSAPNLYRIEDCAFCGGPGGDVVVDGYTEPSPESLLPPGSPGVVDDGHGVRVVGRFAVRDGARRWLLEPLDPMQLNDLCALSGAPERVAGNSGTVELVPVRPRVARDLLDGP